MTNARIQFEEIPLPECAYPPPPYRFKGVGLALVYKIPFARMRDAIPAVYEPDPGKDTIWFKANVYDWQEFRSLQEPETSYPYYESCYKFSVKHGGEVGDYPVKLYLTHDVPVISGIELYGLQKFRADMTFELGPSGVSSSITRNGKKELEVRLDRAKGIMARVTTVFANAMTGSYVKKYVGNILYQAEDGKKEMLYTPTRITRIRYALARPTTVYLREPLEWGILTEAEMARPKYAFLLTSIEAELGPPRSVSL